MKGLEVTTYRGKFFYLVPSIHEDCRGCDFDDPFGCKGGLETDCIRAEKVILREQEQYDKENNQ